MIDFRYFLVSIVAIFFALAIGIVLGSGPLEGNINGIVQGTNAQLAQEKQDLQAQVVQLQTTVDAGQTYAGTTAPLTLFGQLSGQTVALVVLPDANGGQVNAVKSALDQSGARIGATIAVTKAWSDPAQQNVLGRIADGLDKGQTDSNASIAAGQVLADALMTASGPTRVDGQSVAVVSGFTEAGFLQVSDPRTVRKSTLAVVVSPDKTPDLTVTDTYLPLVEAMQKAGRTVVVSGGEAATQDGGLVAEIRGTDLASTISTVDDLDLTMGGPTAAMALVAGNDGTVGHYGIRSGATQVVPALPVP